MKTEQEIKNFIGRMIKDITKEQPDVYLGRQLGAIEMCLIVLGNIEAGASLEPLKRDKEVKKFFGGTKIVKESYMDLIVRMAKDTQ